MVARPGPQPAHRRPRGPRAGDARTARRGRATSSSRSTSRPARSRSSPRARTSTPRRGSRPTARSLAWLEWHHPNMPWDGTELRIGDDRGGRHARRRSDRRRQPDRLDQPAALVARRRPPLRRRARGLDEPVSRLVDGRIEPIAPIEAEFVGAGLACSATRTTPSWPTARSSRSRRSGGRDQLSASRRRRAASATIDAAVHRDERHHGRRRRALVLRGRADPAPSSRDRARPGDRRRRPSCGDRDATTPDPADISVPRPSSSRRPAGRTAYGNCLPAGQPAFRGARTASCRRSIVTSHGGPTAQRSSALTISVQLFTSRGFAVLDVDYGGSTGYGKEYRKRLEGQWGVVDLDDCVNGARWLAEQGLVDGERLAIRGGSASGFTTLCCAGLHATRSRPACTLLRDRRPRDVRARTPTSSSRATWTLVGPWPEAKQLYLDRSPINFTSSGSRPGAGPAGRRGPGRPAGPGRARSSTRCGRGGCPHAYLLFPGEDHGFRGGREHHPVVRGGAVVLRPGLRVRAGRPIEPIEVTFLEPAPGGAATA